MFIGSSYNLNNKNTEHPVVVNNIPVSRTDTRKCLGVQVVEKLSWDSHIRHDLTFNKCIKTLLGHVMPHVLILYLVYNILFSLL